MASDQKQVMDMRPGKGFTAAQSNEHLRNWSERGWQQATKVGNYDRTRERLNFEIVNRKIQAIDKSKSIPQRIKELLAARGIKDPNEGLAEPKYRTVANFIFGGSRERMHELAFGNQQVDLRHGADNSGISRSENIEQWAKDVYDFVARKWGEENIAAFIVHLDELNPHVHCTLLPIDRDGHFAYKKIFAGGSIYDYKQRMIELHSEFARVNEKWGLNRGDSIAETGARHRTTEEYRRELSHECTTLEREIAEKRLLLNQLKFEIAHAEKRVKGLTTMTNNLSQRKEEMEREIASLSSQIQTGHGDTAALQRKLDQLSEEHQKVLNSLTDKQRKLTEANRKLAELRTLEEEARGRVAGYREEAREYQSSVEKASGDMSRQIHFRVAETALLGAIFELKNVLPSTALDGSKLDGGILQSLALHGESFIKCATMLFAGYVDGATNIAKNCGGGGTTSELPWGRKDDEDDRQWALHCLRQAAKMMRPATGKTVKRK